MDSKIKILIGILIVGLLVVGWQVMENKNALCSSTILNDCDGKKVAAIGIFATTKGCMGLVNEILLPEFANKCEDTKQYVGKMVEVTGVLKMNQCPSATQCRGGMEIQQVDSIKILENQKCDFSPDSESYESYAFSKYAYELHDNYVAVSGNLRVRDSSFTSGTNLTVGDEFYLPSGEEQSVTVKLQKIENNKAYFKFKYGAAPPACKDTVSCDYECNFVIEK